MNGPSLDKFQPMLQDKGTLILNSSLIDPAQTDKHRVKVFAVPVNEIADGLGNTRMANMVALGAYVQATGVLPVKRVQDSLVSVISAHYSHMIPKMPRPCRPGQTTYFSTANTHNHFRAGAAAPAFFSQPR